MSERIAIKAFCHSCGHDWPAVWGGMSLAKTAELLKRADLCPACGSDKIFCGPRPPPINQQYSNQANAAYAVHQPTTEIKGKSTA